MAVIKVIGVSESKGKYEGYDYHNLVLHTERKDLYTVGIRAEQLKIKYRFLNDIFNLGLKPEQVEHLKPKDFENLVGKNVTVSFDMYRNIESVTVVNDNNSAK